MTFCNKDYVTPIEGVHIKENSLNFSLNTLNVSIRDLDQDGFIRLNHTSSEDIFKTSWSRPKYSSWSYVFRRLAKNLQDIFKTSSRRRQDVIKTFKRSCKDIFKTTCKNVFKTFSRRTIKLQFSCSLLLPVYKWSRENTQPEICVTPFLKRWKVVVGQ